MEKDIMEIKEKLAAIESLLQRLPEIQGEKNKHEILREEQNLMLQLINLMFSELHKNKTVPIVLDGQKIAEAVQSTTHDNHEA